MAINPNHTAEDLNETKCSIVEKSISKERAEFLKDLLEYNRYTVVVAHAAPPKAAKAAPAAETTDTPVETPPPPAEPTLFTVGVTDLLFNPINAVFGRLLKARNGHVVTLAYWNQEEKISHDEVPYFEHKK